MKKHQNQVFNSFFQAIVVGGGHAGIEAIFALANRGFNVALITLDQTKLASMPCNPAIGGPAKGILTREIDALGGMQGILSDQAMIQIKMLNESKGPAVRALRAQIDKEKYSSLTLKMVLKNPHITLIESQVEAVLVQDNQVVGIQCADNNTIWSQHVILTTGTYMDSRILKGQEAIKSGPDNQKTSELLSHCLKTLGFNLQRLKTGTPPRVLTSSIDFSEVEKEQLPEPTHYFSYRSKATLKAQVHCYLTYTNQQTHEIIQQNLQQSSMYSGLINGVGPRYCPSIEDKVVRFADKSRHQIFYEPETIKGDVIYINGFSTSMPNEIQEQLVKTLPGMKNAVILKWGYAIEYDAIDPLELKRTLESKKIQNLWFAGQINGTSGYEEAAAQGLMAGINAGQALLQKAPIILRRDQAYIGVLIDDLVTKGTREPYRMLTSRAEYRLLLRNDNADERLMAIGFDLGLISRDIFEKMRKKYEEIDQQIERLKTTYVSALSEIGQKYNLTHGPSYYDLIKRPEIAVDQIINHPYSFEINLRVKLEGYIAKQTQQAKKLIHWELYPIPALINYELVPNLAFEAKQKLQQIKPQTVGQAMRISGINPSDIQMLIFYLKFRFNHVNSTNTVSE